MIRSPLALLSSSYIDEVNPVLLNMPIGVRPSSRAEPSLVRSDALFVEPSKTPSHSLLLVVNCSIESASWAGLVGQVSYFIGLMEGCIPSHTISPSRSQKTGQVIKKANEFIYYLVPHVLVLAYSRFRSRFRSRSRSRIIVSSGALSSPSFFLHEEKMDADGTSISWRS